MEQYIRHYCAKGYSGLIQAVKLTIDDISWFFNSGISINEHLSTQGFAGYYLSEVRHYTDGKWMLDITELRFRDIPCLSVPIINKYASDSPARDIPYYKQIRPYINNDRLFCCGTDVIIKNEKDQYVIGKRLDNKAWAFPVGAKELSESIHTTAINETYEEFGITIDNIRLVAVLSGPELKFVYPNGHKMQFVSFLFSADYRDEALRVNDHENTDARWVDMDTVLSLLPWVYAKRIVYFASSDGTVIIE